MNPPVDIPSVPVVSESVPAPRSLLIVRLTALGDIVFSLQVVQTVARQWPGCRITWVVRDRFAPLVKAVPFVHEVISYRRKEGWRGLHEVWRALRADGRRFDMVWDMHGLIRPALMATCARSSQKWGPRSKKGLRGLTYSRRLDRPAGEGPHHAITHQQQFPLAAGLDSRIVLPLSLKPSAKAFGWEGFFEGNPLERFVIFTDSSSPAKTWPHFDELTRMIWERIPGSRVAWCAGKPAVPRLPGDTAPPEGRFLNLTGCPMDEMIALVRQPSVFIGNDTGPMHLSASLGNRVLALFGPTDPARFGPWPRDSIRHRAVRAPDGVMANLQPESVFEGLGQLLSAG